MNFAARKHVLEYDDVMNKQREVIYAERNAILDGKDIHDRVEEMIERHHHQRGARVRPERTYAEEWDWDGMRTWFIATSPASPFDAEEFKGGREPARAGGHPHRTALEARYEAKEMEIGEEHARGLERFVMLSVIDPRWMDHLSEMDYLKEGIGLRAMGQRDPIVEYKAEAYNMFEGLVASINEGFLRTVMHVQIQFEQAAPVPSPMAAMNYSAPSESDIFGGLEAVGAAVGAPAMAEMASGSETMAAGAEASRAAGPGRTYVKDTDDPWANVGRNEPCPCGSGKKYKKCHGAA